MRIHSRQSIEERSRNTENAANHRRLQGEFRFDPEFLLGRKRSLEIV